MLKQTKIICTMGPATENRETLKELIAAGLNVVRVNFSHATPADAIDRVKMIDSINEELGLNIAWLVDTKGPEIRTHTFGQPKVLLEKGKQVTVHMDEVVGDETKFSVTYEGLVDCVEVGSTILVDDGLIELKVVEKQPRALVCEILNQGFVSNKKGINVPNAKLDMPYISEKDKGDMEFGCENGASFVAASFVRRLSDVQEIRAILDAKGRQDMGIIAKIENQEGVDNIDEILTLADGIMVARGDLGVEVPMEEVPYIQKTIIDKCNLLGKIVVVATQMLDSMERNPRPTRAEVGDVYRAIYDGADATMLSGETAKGDYPVKAVQTMAQIAMRATREINHKELLKKYVDEVTTTAYEALALSVSELVQKTNAKAVFVFTEYGVTARQVSRFRPNAPIIAITTNPQTVKNLSLNWGVYGILKGGFTSLESKFEIVNANAKEMGIKPGELVIVTGGHPDGTRATNFIKIVEIK